MSTVGAKAAGRHVFYLEASCAASGSVKELVERFEGLAHRSRAAPPAQLAGAAQVVQLGPPTLVGTASHGQQDGESGHAHPSTCLPLQLQVSTA